MYLVFPHSCRIVDTLGTWRHHLMVVALFLTIKAVSDGKWPLVKILWASGLIMRLFRVHRFIITNILMIVCISVPDELREV